MDRLNQIRGEAGDLRDSTFDTSSPPSEAFMSANESSSKYFSLSEVDSTFSISPSKDSSACTTTEPDRTITVESDLISTLSPIAKKSDLDSYKIGKQIEAANILSGGVNIFEDNDNSYDGDELVIDDNVLDEEKPHIELKLAEDAILEKNLTDTLDDTEPKQSKDSEVVLVIDGSNVNAIDIGNSLYLYRKDGQEGLAAVQVIDDGQQQQSFKFLKVRDNAEGNLEVYEEIKADSPKVPTKEGSSTEKSSHVPISDINKVINEPCSKIVDRINRTPKNELKPIYASESNVDLQSESKSEVNLNGKMKFNESRKSPLISTFTPMTYHSTPNKEGIPLTKTMVDQQLHPSRHSDIKKTIEVLTDSGTSNQKMGDNPGKIKDLFEPTKIQEQEPSTIRKDLNAATKIQEHETSTIAKFDSKTQIKSLEYVNDTDIQAPVPVVSNQKQAENESEVEKEIEEIAINQAETKPENYKNHIAISKEETRDDKTKNECEPTITDNIISPDLIMHNDLVNSEENQGIDKSVGNLINNYTKSKIEEVSSKIQDKIEAIKKIPCTEKISSKENAIINNESGKSEKVIDELNLPSLNIDAGKLEDCNEKLTDLISHEQSILPSVNEIHTHTSDTEESKNLQIMENIDPLIKNNNNTVNQSSSAVEDNIPNEVNDADNNSSNIENKLETDNKISREINLDNNKKKTGMSDLKIPHESINPDNVSYDKKGINEVVQGNISNINKNNKHTVTLETENKINPIMGQKYIPVTNVITNSGSSKINSSKIIIKEIKIAQSEISNNKHIELQKEVPKTKISISNPNSTNSAVPFGKWTEANRQEFLNKIKESKIPSNSSNSKQIKQPNDLNRRDVLKKIDSQRQSTVHFHPKISDFGTMPKLSSKIDSFTTKTPVVQQTNTINVQPSLTKPKPAVSKKVTKEGTLDTEQLIQRRIINSQDLIDKTIEGIITKAIKMKNIPDHMKEQNTIHTVENPKNAMPLPGSLDDIEMKMNELHGVSFTEQPVHELPQVHDSNTINKSETQNVNKYTKIQSLLPYKTRDHSKSSKETTHEEISDEEILEHEPVTGDVNISKHNLISLLSKKDKPIPKPKKDTIITEKDFDKFFRRNSITYENCLTVNFDGKEQHNVIQTVVEKEVPVKKLTRNELLLAESKAKSSNKQNIATRHNSQTSKIPTLRSTNEEDSYTKNYQSKVQMAYQSALTAKRNLECPITIIEDKPVKVIFTDSHTEFTPTQLNVQGQELLPSKKSDSDLLTHSASESLDSDILDATHDTKIQDETKSKSKHQRKQVLTPVDEPELELIEPSDLGFKISPMKKRKVKDDTDKNIKNLVPKKSYLLNRNVTEDQTLKSEQIKNTFHETDNRNDNFINHTDAISAIDNLVKAAELIENQSENNSSNITNQTIEITQNTPVKRGRGRPRKYPLPEQGSEINKSLSPQKKPRLIDAKVTKNYTDSDESSDGEIIKENWTMGKINENIVCPICNKLFRSENVVFKHVKHCTGPSPNRSDSDKRSPRRLRHSQESDGQLRDSSSDDTDDGDDDENFKSKYNVAKCLNVNDDIIVIEDTPIKEKANHSESKKELRNAKTQPSVNNLICEFCGKTFRQLSYLVSHKLQHKKEDTNKSENEKNTTKSVFSCEVCKKEFRKLHHLVQHRIIHNPTSLPTRLHRKSSSEQNESKHSNTQNYSTQSDDASAGFRCEPCDKSFRKLHHLVEHRETHVGINKKGTAEAQKTQLAHNCDMCKKVFKKLQDLLEHKEQHFETSSEKSDDKSVKSSLSTKDIIHECSLCYMVFPNEHSLNKHTVICLRKKKQSAAKQAAKNIEAKETSDAENINSDESILLQNADSNVHSDQNDKCEESEEPKKGCEKSLQTNKTEELEDVENKDTLEKIRERKRSLETNPINMDVISTKKLSSITEEIISKNDNIETPAKIKKTEDKEHNTISYTPTPKKKFLHKDKITPSVTKRRKTLNVPVPDIKDSKPSVESSDDDEVRYMLNPNFKEEDSSESKIFIQIRTTKRNSLQIERPNSKDLVKRRISLQHPPKMPRLKVKAIETKPKIVPKVEKFMKVSNTNRKTTTSTDSDDSDVKYSFPETVHTKIKSKYVETKLKKQVAGKRKSLSGIAKRKSLGKLSNTPKKRTIEAGHRCDCGQLFSSAALLARHATLAHTPPRIRRRRDCDPPVESFKQSRPSTKPSVQSNNSSTQSTKQSTLSAKRSPQKTKPSTLSAKRSPQTTKSSSQATNPNKQIESSRKSSVKSKKSMNTNNSKCNNQKVYGVTTRKSSVSSCEAKTSKDIVTSEATIKSLRSAHRGVPVPEKMRKMTEKARK